VAHCRFTLKRTVEGETVERRFMRADMLPDEASAKMATLGKARLIIDQNGEPVERRGPDGLTTLRTRA
jgi:hypothetical protein